MSTEFTLADIFIEPGARYAAPLYLHAISTLLPPIQSGGPFGPSGPSPEDRCKGKSYF